jgi:hypothetical protein
MRIANHNERISGADEKTSLEDLPLRFSWHTHDSYVGMLRVGDRR